MQDIPHTTLNVVVCSVFCFCSYVDNRDGMIFAAYIPANDSWLGIVGMLQREDADWAFPTISVNAQRLGYIDYIGVTPIWTRIRINDTQALEFFLFFYYSCRTLTPPWL